MAQKYVFGPALSRRLGRSLGVDVVPFKTCTYDCIYCQLGPTTVHTIERKPYVPLGDVLDEVRLKLDGGAAADYVTIGGSGEPTLYSELGALISGIKALTPTPVAVITNGSLLWDPAVREDLRLADVVLPSLDAADAATFLAVNRPSPHVTFERMIEGLAAFRESYQGRIWLEIFVTAPIDPANYPIDALIGHIGRIRPDRIHLNTLSRPAPGSTAEPVAPNIMHEIARRLGPTAEVIADFPLPAASGAVQMSATEDDVVALVRRHPCNLEDIAGGLCISPLEAFKLVERLIEQGKLETTSRDNVAFYIAAGSS
jgi:wyosine [tRNA(Phe)-imidazoG37] synthetase (radical SAM superfamily)